MARNGANRLNKGYVGVNKFASTTEGIINARNDYLNKVQNTVSLDGLSASFVLDFTGATSNWLPFLTFRRGNTATFLGSSGYITEAQVDQPRIAYDRFGNTLGLIIEEPARHPITWSEDISNAAWGKSGLTGLTVGVAYNVALAPDGTTTADMIIPSTVVGGGKVLSRLSGIGGLPGFPVSISAFVKKAGNTFNAIRYVAQFSTASPVEDSLSITVNLNDGSVSNVVASGNAQGLNVRSDFAYLVEPYPNDWYRVSISGRPISSNRLQAIYPLRGITSNINELGDNVNGVYVWGLNWSMTSSPIQYKKTEGSAINTVSDDCIIQGSSFTSWFANQGSFYAEFYNKQDYFNQPANIGPAIAAGNCTVFSTQYSFQKILKISNPVVNGNDAVAMEITNDSLITTRGYTGYQQLNKAAITYTGTGATYTINFSLNGSEPLTLVTPSYRIEGATQGNFRPDLIRWLTIGSCGLSGATSPTSFFGHYNGIIRKIDFYSTPLTKDQLRKITSV
jgi:hypothetical protein